EARTALQQAVDALLPSGEVEEHDSYVDPLILRRLRLELGARLESGVILAAESDMRVLAELRLEAGRHDEEIAEVGLVLHDLGTGRLQVREPRLPDWRIELHEVGSPRRAAPRGRPFRRNGWLTVAGVESFGAHIQEIRILHRLEFQAVRGQSGHR